MYLLQYADLQDVTGVEVKKEDVVQLKDIYYNGSNIEVIKLKRELKVDITKLDKLDKPFVGKTIYIVEEVVGSNSEIWLNQLITRYFVEL